MDLLSSSDLENLNNYKYLSEDNTILSKKLNWCWHWIQKHIPKYTHPNVITLMGIFSIVFGYALSGTKYSNIIMSLCILFYMGTDNIDGIHARNTKQTSIIGEYFDHLGDLIALSFIGTYLCNQLGFQTNFVAKNIIMSFASVNFICHHWDAINSKKITFDKYSDTAMILISCSLITLSNIKLPQFLINNYWLLLVCICGPVFYQFVNKIKKEETINDSSLIEFKQRWILYWVLKILIRFFNLSLNVWTIPIADLLLELDTINYKIFNRTFVNQYLLLSIPLIHWISDYALLIIVLGYVGFFVYRISLELEINLFANPPSVYLPRVYCCGVFDLCHLGHMKLFEKIAKSYDYPIWLIVGVHSDATVRDYKRDPIINEKFREESVKLCKYVNEVLPNAALIVTKEFCIDNKIDVVIIGEEYKGNKDIIWYQGGMELGIHKYISRFEELSTTDILKKSKLYE